MSFAANLAMSSRVMTTPANLPMSATVLDFICLFTHDLKRKQKRWQDGTLKYHTFNKRVMVFDDRNHFIGDAHWQEDGDLQEGDELELDRGSAIVQVSECTGHREQDLTDLLDKRAREVEKRRAQATARTPRASAATTAAARQDQSSVPPQRHRPLSSIVGTPSRIGRAAIPQHSPFEVRQIAQRANQGDQPEEPRPTKKRRMEDSPLQKSSHARSLFGATLTLSAVPVSTAFSRSQALRDRSNEEVEAQPVVSKPVARTLPKEPVRDRRDSPQSSEEVVCLSSPSEPKPVEPPIRSQRPSRLHVSRTRPNHQPNRAEPSAGAFKGSSAHPVPSRQPLEEVLPNDATTTHEIQIIEEDTQQDTPSPPQAQKKTKTPPKRKRDVPKVKGKAVNPELKPKQRAENPVVSRNPPPPRDEPRTELRIKTRQRRGLLMMSEKVAKKPRVEVPSTKQHSVEPRSSPILVPESPPSQLGRGSESQVSQAAENEDSLSTLPKPSKEVTPEPTVTEPNHTHGKNKDKWSSVTSNPVVVDKIPPRLPDVDNGCAASVQPEEEAVSDDEEPIRSRNLRSRRGNQTLRKRRMPASSEDESDATPPEPPVASRKAKKPQPVDDQNSDSAPRITRMARKSVKSREILNFVVPDNDHVFKPPAVFARSVAEKQKGPDDSVTRNQLESHAEEPHAITHPTNVQKVVPSKANKDEVDKSEPQPKPRLSNPATRGKKAARKEDAAGIPPQTIVQLEPVAPQRPKVTKTQPQEKTAELPGFAKANGGAWSRHAEDLLGITRPVNRPARR